MAPRDPWNSTGPSFADLMAAAAWAPPNLPLFKGAPTAAAGTATTAAGPPMAAPNPSPSGESVSRKGLSPARWARDSFSTGRGWTI